MASAAAGGKVSVLGPVSTLATQRLAVRPLDLDRVHMNGGFLGDWRSANQQSTVDLNRVELQIERAMVEEMREDLFSSRVVVARVAAPACDDTAWQRTGWTTLGEAPPERGREVELVAVPYHLWANRGPSVMRVFTPIWSAG
jgi:DUF1680 family protein